MNTSQMDPVKRQDGYGIPQFSSTSDTNRTLLPSVTGRVRSQRDIGKFWECRYYSDSQLSTRLADNRVTSLPELTEHTQMTTTSRRPPPAHAVASTTRRLEDPRMKNWSSELPAGSRRSWRQSTDSVSQTRPARVSVLPENNSHWTENHSQQPSTSTTLRRSSSMRGRFVDVSKMPVVRKVSLSMDSIVDKHSVVILSRLL